MGRKKEVRVPHANRAVNEEQNLQNKRLRSLYDAIDAGRNKDAIDIADKLIRKFGGKERNTSNDRVTVNTANALKALALIRGENTSEAAVIVENCEHALVESDFNEGTMQILFHCFKESYVPTRIPQLLEKILKIQTPTESLLLDLYYGYARVMDFKNQQRVANLLYKEYENLKYMLWTISSLIMQAILTPSLALKMYYPLAQRMLEKAFKIEEGDWKPGRTEILLNYHVQTQQQQYDKALNLLDTVSTHGTLNEADTKNMRYELLKLAKKFDEIFVFVEEEVKIDALNLLAWDILFWTYNQAMESQDTGMKMRVLATLERLSCEYLPESNDKTGHYGCLLKLLFMRRLERHGYIKQVEELTPRFGSVLHLLKRLISLTYKRPNCYFDLCKFLYMLSDEEKGELAKFVDEEFKDHLSTINDASLTRNLLRTGFGYFQKMPISERNDFVLKLACDFREMSKDDPDSDNHAKRVAAIIGNILWDSYIQTGSIAHLYDLTVLLEMIFMRCSNAYIAAVLLMRVYTILGGMNRIVTLFNQLDIKFFQRDALGYLSFTSAMQFGRFREAIGYYTSVTAQFDHNERETSESIVAANRICNLDQIPRLVEFSAKCRASIYAYGADVINQLLSACFSISNLQLALITMRGDDERTDWNRVIDSRDFVILESSALSDDRIIEEVKRLSFIETADFIKLLKAMSRAVSNVGVANLPKSIFDGDVAALLTHVAYCKSAYKTSKVSHYLQGFGAPQLISLVGNAFLEPLLNLLDITSLIFEIENSPDFEKSFAQLVEIANRLTKKIKFEKLLACWNPSKQSFAEFFERGTHCLLMMTLCEILIKLMEAHVVEILPKLQKDLTWERIEKENIQYQEFIDNMAYLNLTSEENHCNDETATTKADRKSKKAKPVVTKTFEELTDEQKIVAGFKFVQRKLVNKSCEFEQQIRHAIDQLKNTTTFSPEENRIDLKKAGMEENEIFVGKQLFFSHARSLDDLRTANKRIQFFVSLPRFSLLKVRSINPNNAPT